MHPSAGQLVALPGCGLPALHSTRRALAPLLARGRAADALPALMAAAFALCAGAHRLAAERAVRAARGDLGDLGDLGDVGDLGDGPTEPAHARALQWDTLREHLRRLWLDWPRTLGAPTAAGGPDAASDARRLASCPALAPGEPPTGEAAEQRLADTRTWLAEHVYGQPVADWLAGWCHHPERWLNAWCAGSVTDAARHLAACRTTALGLPSRPVPLSVHASRLELTRLVAQLDRDPRFELHPVWRGRCAETGPWTRLNDPLAVPDAQGEHPIANAWLRLGARLADLARLVLPDRPAQAGAGWLRQGAFAPEPGIGVAWCEMARGLLVHRVRLAADDPATVADCRVLAPTEWNFHPHGSVAQTLARLPPQVKPSTVRVLAAAFDPCVELVVAPAAADHGQEAHDA